MGGVLKLLELECGEIGMGVSAGTRRGWRDTWIFWVFKDLRS